MPDEASTQVAQLTRRLARADEDAFREFHALYFDRLYRFLLVVARGQEHEAQEALQETLLRVLRHTRPFDTEDAFWNWLKVVARNAARDGGRKRHRYLSFLKIFAQNDSHNQSHELDEENLWQEVLTESLGKLDAEDRHLIEAKYLHDCTVKELSQKTGLSDKAVESRLLRLRRALREQMLTKLHKL
jgi:RNA polymerase sigma-70 factor (ECF subfamily)